MVRFRLLLVTLTVWLIFIFNVERPNFYFMNLDSIDLDSVVYAVAGFITIAILLLPDISKRSGLVFSSTLIIYILFKTTFGNGFTDSTQVPFIITEIVVLFFSVQITRWVSLALTNFEFAVENVLLKPDHLHLLPAGEGEEKINHELFRARRFNRPVSFILIRMEYLRQSLNQKEGYKFDMEAALQYRFFQLRIAQIVESMLYKVDTLVWDNDDLVICLPETQREEAEKLAINLNTQIQVRLNIELMMGISVFQENGFIYSDLVESAAKDLRRFPVNKISDTSEFPAFSSASMENSPSATQQTKPADSVQQKVSFSEIVDFTRTVINPLPRVGVAAIAIKRPQKDDLRNPDFWIYELSPQSEVSRSFYKIIKRVIDLTLVILAGPFILPVMLLIALGIKMTDGGEIFFKQQRTGLGGHRFEMYKFRTMVPDAEEKLKELAAQGLAKLDENGKLAEPLKLKHDPRVTKIGRILRKTSLDEIPQLHNVVRGDMSLVGPRPTSWDIDSYKLIHTERLSVRPGITGLWQICARGDTDFDTWVEWDMAYIDRMSLSLDIHILIRTFVKVLKSKGAR